MSNAAYSAGSPSGKMTARGTRAAPGRRTKLVALTGYAMPRVPTAALDAGFAMHVAIPCTAAKPAEILAP